MSAHGSRRALVVDDSRTTRRILARMLDDLGFTVREASDGVEAMEDVARDGAPEVALVDWNMPRMDGLELVRELRADTAHEHCRILMVTTEAEVERLVEALDAGADEYAMKPFTKDVIADKLALLGVVGEAS
ncbi:response regulator [Egibacter rhizosphaerae]|uniref:Response regulator n=1 Tax=Egibacter rhizosphaerae TaxID=1670831 RepID=A0A411YJI0_9ACTN|nr:response regulator [Egibacter rhizosphaerae]QBI21256.1 response regulator [Egibacter rhizosphaerae]